jgi:FeS assembly SUF system protein
LLSRGINGITLADALVTGRMAEGRSSGMAMKEQSETQGTSRCERMTEADDHTLDALGAAPVTAAGEPIPVALISKTLTDGVIAALRTVYDPEIPVNIYDLGLIYRIEPGEQGSVEIDMTLTAPGCPLASDILRSVQTAVGAIEGIGSVTVTLVFDPAWDQSKMSEEAKLELGLM